MRKFFDDYFNIRKMIKSKREYRQQMKRIELLPEDYQYVFRMIQKYMWQSVSGAGYDMMKVQGSLADLFEEGAADGREVLDITGTDVAGFAEELMKSTRTYEQDQKEKLNRKISRKLKNRQ